MQSTKILPIVVVVSAILVTLFDPSFGKDCSKIFKRDERPSNVSEECMVSMLNASTSDADNDDKCFARCFLRGLKYMVDGPKFNPEAVKMDIEKFVEDEEAKKLLTESFKKCVDEAEKFVGGKITKENECKVASQYMVCDMREDEKFHHDMKCDHPKNSSESES